MKHSMIFVLSVVLTAFLYSFPSYTGYSGAAGSKGTCASSCHGSGTGTITLSGIPSVYTSGATYTVTVKNSSGSSISNFNCSSRKGSTTIVAGTFIAGTNSALYSVSGNENGVRASSNNITSSVFQWKAPAAGTGNVTFSLAGLQGSKSGATTKLTVSSTESTTGITGTSTESFQFQLEQNYPNPFNPSTLIRYTVPVTGPVRLTVTDVIGNELFTLVNEVQESGAHSYLFNMSEISSQLKRPVSSGVYFYSLRFREMVLTKKMVVIK